MKNSLSIRQNSILQFIKDFLNAHPYPPTIRAIRNGCNISSTSVVYYNLQILQRKGFIQRQREVSRGIQLIGKSPTSQDVLELPVVGYIAAGQPLHVPETVSENTDPVETVELPAFVSNGKTNLFGVRVKGDSMVDVHILDGDLVVLERTRHAEAGQMVAAEITSENSITLKRFYLEGNMVRLQPENPEHDPIIVPAQDVAVRGKVVGVMRSV